MASSGDSDTVCLFLSPAEPNAVMISLLNCGAPSSNQLSSMHESSMINTIITTPYSVAYSSIRRVKVNLA